VTLLDGDTYGALFDSFQRTAWRLEVQPTYNIPSEQADVDAFLTGTPKPDDYIADWVEQIQDWKVAGKTIARVRVQTDPLTDYQRYQLAWTLPTNTAAGEQVRLFPAAVAAGLDLPQQDFWIFDDATIVHLNFTPDGRLEGRELIDAPDWDLYRGWQKTAVAYSVPFEAVRDAGT
jgi:Family of unknown function (DUF6879)